MFKLATSLLLVFVLQAGSSFAADKEIKKRHHKAHEHGSGNLNLAIDGNKLMIEMEIPAYDIVGFEYEPKDKMQKDKVEASINTFKNVSEVLVIPTEAKCSLSQPVNVKSEMMKEADDHHKKEQHAVDHHEKGESHDHDEDGVHSEFHVTYQFTCQNILSVDQIAFPLFVKFSEMKKLKAQGISQNGQFSQELSPSSSTFNLKK